uniref:Predicted gene 28434 n=1 Tax=Mus musculus TaxID=10090 RepID=A0A087WPU2_MOUSE
MKILILTVITLNFVIFFPGAFQENEASDSICCHLEPKCLLIKAEKR